MTNYNDLLAKQFQTTPLIAGNIIALIDEGNTIPFIARYRKEVTNSMDDQVLRDFADRLDYLRKLDERKATVVNSITEQGFMTDEIAAALSAAQTLTEVEDIYRPYKPKKKTRATVAVAKGLQSLADIIFAQDAKTNPEAEAQNYISEEKGVLTIQEAIDGAKDIIAERISDDANLRKILRNQLHEHGIVTTTLIRDKKSKTDEPKQQSDKKQKTDKLLVYEMYDNFIEPVKKIVSHRILAINRAEKEDCLKCTIEINEELPLNAIEKLFLTDKKDTNKCSHLVQEAGHDAYKRLLKPSIENEVRSELFDTASEQAIKMFEVNLRPLLLQPPIKNKIVLGLDPGYRTGCKIIVVDGNGNVLDRAVVYFTEPHNKTEESKKILTNLINKHSVQVIAIGNGTASKESEIFIAALIKEIPDKNLQYMVVNEAGASVYSASKLAAEEFPDFDVAHRSAASIARRLQDPLAELIKIDPKSIGVGQYQHDMPQKRLSDVLEGVVESCVNSVGVNLNSASAALLTYVAGLNAAIAKNVVTHRAANGTFTSRSELTGVPKLGAKAFEQCAGFLRIPESKNILDNTAVHPESYPAAKKLLELLNITGDTSKTYSLLEAYGIEKAAAQIGVGAPTLIDIAVELSKPGRDIRDDLPPPMLRSDIMDLNDLREGMELQGTVRNVIDFGVFVDIGVHQDGLVHISQITDQYIKHPSEVLTVGDVVKVRVLGVEKAKNRISLTMKHDLTQVKKLPQKPRSDFQKPAPTANQTRKPEPSLEDSLKALANKFNKY